MKKLLLLFLLISTITFAQGKSFQITQKNCIPKKGYYLKLKEVTGDSRCPEGVQCVWAGEVTFIVMAYKDRELVEEVQHKISSGNDTEIIRWFSTFYPDKKIKSIGVFPSRKPNKPLRKKDYFLKVFLED